MFLPNRRWISIGLKGLTSRNPGFLSLMNVKSKERKILAKSDQIAASFTLRPWRKKRHLTSIGLYRITSQRQYQLLHRTLKPNVVPYFILICFILKQTLLHFSLLHATVIYFISLLIYLTFLHFILVYFTARFLALTLCNSFCCTLYYYTLL